VVYEFLDVEIDGISARRSFFHYLLGPWGLYGQRLVALHAACAFDCRENFGMGPAATL
jgi:hypothetical protein